jgi:hypothetical protein
MNWEILRMALHSGRNKNKTRQKKLELLITPKMTFFFNPGGFL